MLVFFIYIYLHLKIQSQMWIHPFKRHWWLQNSNELMALCSASVTTKVIVSFFKKENQFTKIHMKFSNIWGIYSKMVLKYTKISKQRVTQNSFCLVAVDYYLKFCANIYHQKILSFLTHRETYKQNIGPKRLENGS